MCDTPIGPVECIRCPICKTRPSIEFPAKFECLKCAQINQVTVRTDRMKGPIVWLAGDLRSQD
jgi:hypothetical protein